MKFVIIGGGIAGVTCALDLLQQIAQSPNRDRHSVVLITPTSTVKSVTNVTTLTRHLEIFEVCVSRVRE
jgi:2-polyprenyl-6-methoxyphenol hydroxylase-like FAD-dependent oxidoreductase